MRDIANLILPRLWLGNREASIDPEFLQKHHISVVFNCTKDLPFTDLPVKKYRVPVDDNLQKQELDNMETWGPEAVYKVLAEYHRGETILIHCFAGMQRSAAIMAMTLIVLSDKPADTVIAFIRSKRPIAFFPGENFGRSIRGFEGTWRSDRVRLQ
jgi:predicted protein tyrosine phosphatase